MLSVSDVEVELRASEGTCASDRTRQVQPDHALSRWAIDLLSNFTRERVEEIRETWVSRKSPRESVKERFSSSRAKWICCIHISPCFSSAVFDAVDSTGRAKLTDASQGSPILLGPQRPRVFHWARWRADGAIDR